MSNYIITRAKIVLPSSSLKTLYYSLIHPHLLYCMVCLYIQQLHHAKKHHLHLFYAKKAIHTISKSKHNANTLSLHTLKILQYHLIILSPLPKDYSYTLSITNTAHLLYTTHGPQSDSAITLMTMTMTFRTPMTFTVYSLCKD